MRGRVMQNALRCQSVSVPLRLRHVRYNHDLRRYKLPRFLHNWPFYAVCNLTKSRDSSRTCFLISALRRLYDSLDERRRNLRVVAGSAKQISQRLSFRPAARIPRDAGSELTRRQPVLWHRDRRLSSGINELRRIAHEQKRKSWMGRESSGF